MWQSVCGCLRFYHSFWWKESTSHIVNNHKWQVPVFINSITFRSSLKMSDPPDFDPCECVWNHELAMRRLISLVSLLFIFFLIVLFFSLTVYILSSPFTILLTASIISVVLHRHSVWWHSWFTRTSAEWRKYAFFHHLLGCFGDGTVLSSTWLNSPSRRQKTQWQSGIIKLQIYNIKGYYIQMNVGIWSKTT